MKTKLTSLRNFNSKLIYESHQYRVNVEVVKSRVHLEVFSVSTIKHTVYELIN